MLCTSCETEVADDAAVCPNCDAVLDPSLFDVAPPPDDAPPPPKKKPTGKPAGKPLRKPVSSGGKPGVKKKPLPKKKPADDDDAGYRDPPPKQNWRDQLSEEDWKSTAGREPEKFEVDRTLDPDDFLANVKRFVFELVVADKMALFGTAVMLLATFFPWKETVAHGDVLGVFSSGLVVTGLGALALAGLIVRVRKSFPSLNPILPWMAQLGSIGFSGFWCLVYMKMSWDSTLAQSTIGNYQQWVSKPSFGLILALLAAIVALVGTIFGLKDLGR